MLALYGVVEPTHELPKTPGIAGGELRLISNGEVAVVCSELPADTELSAEDANDFLEVLLAVLEGGTVLPLSLGTVVDAADKVVAEFLDPQAENLRAQLDRLRDLVEVHVDVDDDEASVISDLAARQGIRTPAGAGLDQRIAVGEQVGALLVEQRRAIADELVAAFGKVAEQSAPRSVINGPEDPVLRWAFLVRRDAIADFDDAQQALQRQNPELAIRSVGPLPPANFLAPPQSPPAAGQHDSGQPAEGGSWGW